MKPTYLYIKTHNVTGLKYFGKTCQKDPFKYKGSGTRWLNHVRIHGLDITTEILGLFLDETECKRVALEFSIQNNIVDSEEWANLQPETLIGCPFDFVTYLESRKNDLEFVQQRSESLSRAMRDKHKRGVYKYWTMERQLEVSRLALTEASRAKRLESFKEIGHQQGEKNSQFGTMWITDGLKSTRISKEDTIPEGWRKGRIIKQKLISLV